VFGTLHTNSATKTVDRIIDVFPDSQQSQIRTMLSESLRGVVAQALLPRADGEGRAPVVEILVNLPAVANLIREGKTFQIASAMQTKRAQGMLTFEASINDLVRQGVINRQDGMNFLGRRHNSISSSGNGPSSAHSPAARELNTVSY
jgi:twitching motility protein PilT